jgi:hypothetical protein
MEACFRALAEAAGPGAEETIGIHGYLAFHAAILRYDAARDGGSAPLQELRLRCLANVYDQCAAP